MQENRVHLYFCVRCVYYICTSSLNPQVSLSRFLSDYKLILEGLIRGYTP